MKAVITVTGKDGLGIVAKVSTECAKYGINIIDISQSVLQEYFAMILIADIDSLNVGFTDFADHLKEMGRACNLEIQAMHEDIFNSMHKI